MENHIFFHPLKIDIYYVCEISEYIKHMTSQIFMSMISCHVYLLEKMAVCKTIGLPSHSEVIKVEIKYILLSLSKRKTKCVSKI